MKIARLIIIAFFLNFIWEIFQAPLYAPHFAGVSAFIFVHLKASAGDVLLVFLIVILNALVFQDRFWFQALSAKKAASSVFLGFIIAVIVEKLALASGRWAYNSLMPVIPLFNVGLTPVLQMMILPILSLWIARKRH